MRSRSSQQRNSGTRNEATFSCDVYNFGKVLLELITGRLVGTSAADDSTMKDSIVNTLRYIVSDDKALIANIVDPYLVIHDDILEEVLAVAYIAKACLNSKPSKRPKMTKVLKILEDQKVKAEARGMRPRIEEGRLETKLVFSSGESQFRFIELLRSPAELLGRGNFGSCYKVILKNGPTVVVRRLKPLKPLSIDESREQVGIIADQEHPNLMPLIAHFCFKNEKLLIYKFASKGNAYNRLHARKGNPSRIPFSWSSRLSVARGVARALQHLHINTMSSNVAPHGNLKLSNVLLDENGDVLVTDYGLTTLVAAPTVAKHMVAYKSPEYRSSRTESKKSDVWSYGYLLLELVTGRASTISAEAGPDAVDLFRWVRQSFRNGWNDEIFDEEIRVHGRATYEMVKLLEIGMKCCANSPENRPGMDEVVREVESIKEVNTTWIRTSKDYFNPRT
ncbi:OLC1v1009347C1 [Oldenlandia corymbosa var. corymbosa]|uniref:OLC1v1009347C1 n=1 Tax=Oldenlandia corymbosa var. corymbosa TaxID=529605 RepID=A0AAV1DRM6_OLDCO|nr:OLC1v1009347C1 [Oldenlandia corymbosa var. corymbosa]